MMAPTIAHRPSDASSVDVQPLAASFARQPPERRHVSAGEQQAEGVEREIRRRQQARIHRLTVQDPGLKTETRRAGRIGMTPSRRSGGRKSELESSRKNGGARSASARAQGVEVLRRPAEGRPALAAAWWVVLAAARRAAGRVRHRDGVLVGAVQRGALARPRRWPRSASSSSCCRCSAPIHQAVSANLGDRTAAWLYDRLTEACVGPPGMGHLEDPVAHHRPHGGARFRSRHDRAAAVDLDGLHRQRPGRDGRRRRLGRSCSPRTRWWAAAVLGGRVAGHALAAARERASGATATPTRCAARSATPTTPTGSPSIRRRARSCACSAWPAGRSTASSPGARSCTSCSTRRRGCASGRCCGACCSSSAANVLVFWSLADAALGGRIEPRRRSSSSRRARSARR